MSASDSGADRLAQRSAPEELEHVATVQRAVVQVVDNCLVDPATAVVSTQHSASQPQQHTCR